MAESESDLILEEEDLLLELVRAIVRQPEAVSVECTRGAKATLLTLTVAPEDRGQVIGRERRTLDAIEHLFTKAAYLEGRKTVIQLDGPDVPRQQTKFKPRKRR